MLTDEELLDKIRKIVREEILKSIQELSKLNAIQAKINDNIEVIESVVEDKWEGTNGN
tara:strand:+ start:2607 stop:2780 length:174 start_codon:yes stop_codon:yes gene_type:complete